MNQDLNGNSPLSCTTFFLLDISVSAQRAPDIGSDRNLIEDNF
jgi:hypothetical protein